MLMPPKVARVRRATLTATGEDPVVLARLVIETASSLKRAVVPAIERDHGLPPQSLEVLLRLSQTPGGKMRMTDLAAQTRLTPSGLTRAVDRLCDAGLVCRETCSQDRRGALAALTQSGFDRVADATSCHRAALSELLGALDPSEQARLRVLLERLSARLSGD
jgi:MarR family transcriptional regulator, 2-MHQ and catechol-resistance regulon repressor